MVLGKFVYYQKEKTKTLKVEVCSTLWEKFRGLMFRKNSPPLLFVFDKNKKLTIHSFFCKPFKAIWLDDKKRVTQEKLVFPWRISVSGFGKYLIEVPLSTTNSSK